MYNITDLIKKSIRELSLQDYDRQANLIAYLFYLNLALSVIVIWLVFNLKLGLIDNTSIFKKETIKSMFLSKMQNNESHLGQ